MVYQMGRKVQTVLELGLLTSADLRIIQVHNLRNDGIKVWEWDYERYSEENEFMKGMYYQEDWQNLITIDSMINDKERSDATTAATRARAAQR